MPKPFTYFMAWATATSIGVGVALLGVRVVLESTSPKRPSMVTAPDNVASARLPARTPAPPSPTATARATPTRAASTDRKPSPSPTGKRTPPTPTPTATATATPVRRCEDSQGGFIRSYLLLGGTTALRYSAGEVCLVSATPSLGHEVKVTRDPLGKLLVRFTSRGHLSELLASWNGQPVTRSREVFW